MSTSQCNSESSILSQGGRVIKNSDGTISVYTYNNVTGTLQPKPLTKICCDALLIKDAYFDPQTQKCRWTVSQAGLCSYQIPFDVVLNPKGNDGSIFTTNPDEVCTLDVEFDYLFKFSGDTLSNLANGNLVSECKKVIDVFESIEASMVINAIIPVRNNLQIKEVYKEEFFFKIGTGNLYNYLRRNSDSGFYVTCNTSGNTQEPINLYDLNVNGTLINCATVVNQLTQDLFIQSNLPQTTSGATTFKQTISGTAFASNWKTFKTSITDQTVISAITNEKIKLNIRISGACVDFCVLVDNIRLDKSCSYISNNSIFLSKSPGFDLDRVIDNRKSWVNNTRRVNRLHSIKKVDGTHPIRLTDYFINDERLAINSKEIDLDINIASAIETDIWDYVYDNPCILSGVSIGTTTCTKEVFSPNAFSAVTVYVNQITGKSATTTAITISATSSTTTTTTTTTLGCPAGFTATPANDACQLIQTQAATFNGTGSAIDKGSTFTSYTRNGAAFYAPIQLNSPDLPYQFNHNVYTIVTRNGTAVYATHRVYDPTFWGNPNKSFVAGRLNQVGLKALERDFSIKDINQDPNWVGFSRCINIQSGGTYYVGLAGDNYCRFSIDGIRIVDFTDGSTGTFASWHVFPIQLDSGVHLIEMQGLNAGGQSAFGAEIYFPTGATPFATLTAATSTASTQANVIFSTINFIGQNYNLGQKVGFSCPTGFALNVCDVTPTCTRILNQPIQQVVNTVTSTVNVTVTTPGTLYTQVDLTGLVPTLSAITTNGCVPKTYCCSEYCGDANIDLNSLITQPISRIQTVEDFQYYLTSLLIDAKNRKIISSYPTLRLLYDRYMNSLERCSTNSSQFDYFKMNNFANLIGNYWVDLIEQVVPSTTIWGSTRIYRNTIFDNQKFQYKNYSMLFDVNPFTDPQVLSPATGRTCSTNATTEVIFGNASGSTLFNNQVNIKNYSYVYLVQMNSGSEFIGTVNTTQKPTTIVIADCNIKIVATPKSTYGTNSSNGSITVQVYNANNPLQFSWSNGATTQSISNLSAGVYTVTVTDTVNKTCTATASITIFEEQCNISLSLTGTDPTPGQSDGSITSNVTGEFGTVTYSWSNGATTPSISNLSAGTYSLTVTDSQGCTATTSTSIYEVFNVFAQNVSGTTFRIIQSISPFSVDWGDGTVDSFAAGTYTGPTPNPITHTYSSPYIPYNGSIKFKSFNISGITRVLTDVIGPSGTTNPKIVFTGPEVSKLSGLTQLTAIIRSDLSANTTELPRNLKILTSWNGKMVGDVANLPTGMTFISLTSAEINTLSGNTSAFTPTLSTIQIFGNNTITGDIGNISSGTSIFQIGGNNTVYGDVAGLKDSMRVLTVRGFAALTGNIGDIPTGMTSFVTQAKDNITGSVCGLSAHTLLQALFLENDDDYLVLGTGNTLSGDINCLPKRIDQLLIQGFNTISGSVENMVTGTTTGSSAYRGYFNLRGYNTVGGNISGASNNFSQFFMSGFNTVSGNTADIPSRYEIFNIGGLNRISGDLGLTPTATTYLEIGALNTVNTYTGKNWAATGGLYTIIVTGTSNTGLTSVQLDNLLNDLTGYTWQNTSSSSYVTRFGQARITIKGTATTASLAARNKLSGSTGSGGLGIKLTLV